MAGESPNTEQDWDDMPYAPFVEGITWTHPVDGEVQTPIFTDRTKMPVNYITWAKRIAEGGNGYPQTDEEWIQEWHWQHHAATLSEDLGFYRFAFFTRSAYEWHDENDLVELVDVPEFIDEVTYDFSEYFSEFT